MSQANASKKPTSANIEISTENSNLKEFRTPPHNLAIEQAVLAALMTVAESFEQVGDVLTENDFYATRHKYIFRAIDQLSKENSPYDAVLVHDWLIKQILLDAIGGNIFKFLRILQIFPLVAVAIPTNIAQGFFSLCILTNTSCFLCF